MGVAASLSLPVGAHVIAHVEEFVTVFLVLYGIVLFAYILMSWVRLPYSPTLVQIERFARDVSDPYLRLFRRVIPMAGSLDFSPILAFATLTAIDRLVIWILDHST
jgi:YggT family protein